LILCFRFGFRELVFRKCVVGLRSLGAGPG
jgi:hypothetical protein